MLARRFPLYAKDRSDWYSNCTHGVLSIDLLVLIDGKNEFRPWGIRYRTIPSTQLGARPI